jgi:hypothetical protein
MSQLDRKWLKDHAIDNSKMDNTDSYVLGSLMVTNDSTVGRNFRVIGDASVVGKLTTTGDMTIGQTFHLLGDSSVDGTSYFLGPVVISGDTTVGDNLTVDGTSTFIGPIVRINTIGDTTVGQGLLVNGDTSVSGKLEITQDASLDSLVINKVNTGSGDVLKITNSGSGSSVIVDSSRFVVTNAGRIGVGTPNPQTLLHIKNSTGLSQLEIESGGSGTTQFYLYKSNTNYGGMSGAVSDSGSTTGNSLRVYSDVGNLSFGVPNDSTAMLISPNGFIGLDTTSPSQKLDVVGNINASGNIRAGNDLTVQGDLLASGDATVTGDILVNGDSSVGGNALIDDCVGLGMPIMDPTVKLSIKSTGLNNYAVKVEKYDSNSTYGIVNIMQNSLGHGSMNFLNNTDNGILSMGSVSSDFGEILVASASGVSSISLNGGTGSITANGSIQAQGDIYTEQWNNYTSSSTIIGWGSTTTQEIYYAKIGKLMMCDFYISGVSDSIFTTFTLPYARFSSTAGVFNPSMILINDGGGAQALGYCKITSGNLTVECFTSVTGSSWTASGTKTVRGSIWYFTA